MKRVLIANRGEVARRIGHTCRQMGLETIVLFTEEERSLPHALEGDFGVCLGDGDLGQTYLNIPKLVEIAKTMKADAVHPGYGLLSERAELGEALASEGVSLIGPPPQVVRDMGDKAAAKAMVQKLGVPTIPGYQGPKLGEALFKEAVKLGFPLLIKASAGGGGKGMRVVDRREDFSSLLESARSEALQAFGDDRVLLEKLVLKPRHIEIQVASDRDGHFHLFERECSIQRRYQKIVEEGPSPALDAEKRSEMAESALKIARHIGYSGVGTVEFVLDQGGGYYFLEMNTRLQVEHLVTEMLTGLDLVRLQIMAARGEKFPFAQKDVTQRGHALEVRLYAEDPDRSFFPSSGRLGSIGEVAAPGVRLETGYQSGDFVGTRFDPMLAKLVVHADNRREAIVKAQTALSRLPFWGVKTNRAYLHRILSHPAFLAGRTDTDFIKIHERDLKEAPLTKKHKALAAAAHLLSSRSSPSAWGRLGGFRNV